MLLIIIYCIKLAVLSTPFSGIAADAKEPPQYQHAGHQIEAKALPDLFYLRHVLCDSYLSII